jgi:hypothetical protein
VVAIIGMACQLVIGRCLCTHRHRPLNRAWRRARHTLAYARRAKGRHGSEYVIGADDADAGVLAREQLSGDVLVRPDGKISRRFWTKFTRPVDPEATARPSGHRGAAS